MAKSIRELPIMEQLAIEQALFSRLGDDVSTKNPDSLRSMCDEQIVDNYHAMGAKSYDVHVDGQKVGTYSVRVSKGVPQKVIHNVVVTDPYELERYAKEDATEEAFTYIHLMAQNFAEYLLETYGIVAEGCEVVEETIPEQPPHVMGTTLRVDADKVANAVGGYLPAMVACLIGGQ